jgi:hypothetical protein
MSWIDTPLVFTPRMLLYLVGAVILVDVLKFIVGIVWDIRREKKRRRIV